MKPNRRVVMPAALEFFSLVIPIYPKAYREKVGADGYAKAPVGAGPYKITKVAPDADDAEMSVLAASGGVAANVQRWEGQFGGAKAKTSERTVGGLKVTTVEIHGTYAGSGMPGAPSSGPKEKQVLLAAIVETEPEHFFKLVGGEKTVEKARPDFEKLVASFRAK